MKSHSPSRRAFLKRSGQLAMTGTALPFALNLAAIGEAAAFNSTDYKALVCVFLFGGNDYANTVVTYDDDSYDKYSLIRGGGAGRTAGGIALAQSDLTATLLNPTVPLPPPSLGLPNRQYALHPSMTGLASLFNSGQAAVQLNVGPLVVPLTRAQYNSSNKTLYPVPPKLFSHNDQQSTWQSSRPEGSTVGWGGNLGDLAQPPINSKSTFTCISASGNAVYLSGDQAIQYQVNPNGSTPGAVPIAGVKSSIYGSAAVQSAFANLITAPRSHLLENEYNIVTKRAISAEGDVSAALAAFPADTTSFPSSTNGNPLAVQLKLVARLIAAQSMLGNPRRQVFFVSLGGFDLHDNLISQQPTLLGRVSEALSCFYNATVALGVQNKVTAFTASDFGRTLASNGDGSDHGWGSHHFVVGGAVRGKAFYGTAPSVSIGNTASADDQSHVGQGRLLPTTSVDQYAATMAKWFGVSDAEMPGVLPNITHFGTAAARPDYPTDMGFMMP